MSQGFAVRMSKRWLRSAVAPVLAVVVGGTITAVFLASFIDRESAADPAGIRWLKGILSKPRLLLFGDGDPYRPDLVVRSLSLDPPGPHKPGARIEARVTVLNDGGGPTPTKSGRPVEILTVLYADGVKLDQQVCSHEILPGDSMTATFVLRAPPGPSLISAEVNGRQDFVELDMTNNRGYAMAVIE